VQLQLRRVVVEHGRLRGGRRRCDGGDPARSSATIRSREQELFVKRGAVFAVAVLIGGCTPEASDGVKASAPISEGECKVDDQCRGCTSCFDECLCGGGSSARCAESCNTAVDAGGGDASGPLTPYTATVATEAFDIPPGEEFYRCQDFANPFGRDVAILSSESFMTAGSHHMFVFQKPGARDGSLESCSGLEFQPYIHLSQQSQQRITYPRDVGRLFEAAHGLRVQIHYLNASSQTVRAEIAVTIRASDPDAVPVHAAQIFINTFSINIPPYSAGTANNRCSVPKDINVFSATSHMHQRGKLFTARADDGQLLYETNEWAEPPPWTLSPPRKIKAGGAILIHCDYQNDTDAPLYFGESAATNEMCVFVGSYYPANRGESITCPI
jgi:hypothetical protein